MQCLNFFLRKIECEKDLRGKAGSLKQSSEMVVVSVPHVQWGVLESGEKGKTVLEVKKCDATQSEMDRTKDVRFCKLVVALM